uniref:dUTPase-like domain-containing protein n=1 Tax=viral metagenome TaxID=1070528 RepID=A0A6C0EQI0_9ZZZZ
MTEFDKPVDYKHLLTIYDKIMYLKIFVDSEDQDLKKLYLSAAYNHNSKIVNRLDHIDAGFDLFAPGNKGDELENYDDALRFFGPGWNNAGPVNKLDFEIVCSAKMYTDNNKMYNTGYYMYPRSSLSKTQLRLANATGIIDSGYRGHLMAMFDVVNMRPEDYEKDRDADYYGKKYDRYIQICAPGLVPIIVEIVDTKEDLGEKTERGEGGFGSTGR